MKEKRILAMFITSAVTLIASLAVTFGVLMTLADPVVATGVVRYDYAFNYKNNSLISENGNTLSLKEDIVFQPSSAVVWSDNEDDQVVWFNGSTYQDEIVYADESVSTKIKVVPFRVTNNYAYNIKVKVDVSYDKESSLLGKYTYVKVYDYDKNSFVEISELDNIDLTVGSHKDYAVIIAADDSSNIGKYTINWGNDYQKVDVKVTKVM